MFDVPLDPVCTITDYVSVTRANISGFCLAIVPKDDMYSRKFLTLDDELPKIVSPLNNTLSALNE